MFEDSPTAPISPYAKTKLMMEQLLTDLAVGTDLRALVLRYFNPIGADPELRHGIHVREPSHVLGQLVMAAQGQRDAFEITGTDYPTRDGTGLRDYIHVWDLALAHVAAVERFDAVLDEVAAPSTIINLGTGTGVTVRELVSAVEQVLGQPVPVRAAPRRDGDAVGAYANVDKARRLLGWSARSSLVDGVDNVDIGQVLMDAHPEPELATPESWRPIPEPGAAELVAGALWESAQDPLLAWQNLQGVATSALGVAVAVGEAVGGVGGRVVELVEDALLGSRPGSTSPLAGVVSEQRRVALVSMPLADMKAVRDEHDHTINDVILAVIAGALRGWLLTRGESISNGRELTALVPMSVTEDDGEPTSLGSQVAPHLQPLPIGEPNALMRLHQVAYATQAHKETGRAVDARTLSDIAGFAPTTLHALGVRVSNEVLRRQHDVLVTNVPGPQMTLYAAGERLVASYPVLPLGAGHLLAFGITSYDGQVFFGLTADRDAVADLDVLAQCLDDALEELLDTTVRARNLRQPTRKASAAAKKAAASKAAARQEARRATGQRRAAMRNLASRAVELGTSATRVPAAAKRTVLPPSPTTARKLPTQAPAGTAAKKAAAKKSPAPVKSAPAKKTAPVKKTAPAKTTAPIEKAAPAAKKTPSQAARQTVAKKAPAKKAAAKKAPATKKAATKKATAKKAPAAEPTSGNS